MNKEAVIKYLLECESNEFDVIFNNVSEARPNVFLDWVKGNIEGKLDWV